MTDFGLPEIVRNLVKARNELRERFRSSELQFTFDGNLVGDIGEAVAAELFGVTLTGRSNAGIDGYADSHSVQVKATGTNRGPAFRCIETRADYLLFLAFDFEALTGSVIYNGPERYVLAGFPETWIGQRCISMNAVRAANERVLEKERLPIHRNLTGQRA